MGADHDIARARVLHRKAHFRLLFAAAVGIIVASVEGDDLATRGLVGWDVAAVIFLLGIWRMMATTSLAELRLKAAQQDESAPIILGLMVAAVTASLIGILVEMNNERIAATRPADSFVLLPLCTVLLSWLCMHMLFATHYAHRYYGDRARTDAARPGLIFPEPDAAPGYAEFVYFSLGVGMTYQVSDIMTGTRAFRRLITFHGALSFFYNTFILAFAVSLFSALPSFR